MKREVGWWLKWMLGTRMTYSFTCSSASRTHLHYKYWRHSLLRASNCCLIWHTLHTYDDKQHILELLCLYLIWTIIIFCFVFCTLSPGELSLLGKFFGLLSDQKTSPAKFQKQNGNDDVICFVKIAARVSAHGIHDTKLYNIHIFQFGAIFERVWRWNLWKWDFTSLFQR